MKTFMYTVQNKKNERECTLYRIKKNKPYLIGHVYFDPAFTVGEASEIVKYLVEKKHIPKDCFRDGYLNYEQLNRHYVLYWLN